MNLTIKILDMYNNYQNKILKKINNLNKDLDYLNNIQYKILQTGGNCYNINIITDKNNIIKLLKKIQITTKNTIEKIDFIKNKMNIINNLTKKVILMQLKKKEKEKEIIKLIQTDNNIYSFLDKDIIDKVNNIFIKIYKLSKSPITNKELVKTNINEINELYKELINIKDIDDILIKYSNVYLPLKENKYRIYDDIYFLWDKKILN
jgi:hypothetical protein